MYEHLNLSLHNLNFLMPTWIRLSGGERIITTWEGIRQQAKLAPESDDYFGYSVSVSLDGNTILVSARGENGGGIDRGSAYVLVNNGNLWEVQQKLVANDAEDYDFFGTSVSVSSDGNVAVIGAYLEGGSGIDRGAAYVFIRSDGIWLPQQKLIASDAEDNDQFGTSVSISGDGNTIIIGASNEGNNRGAAYIFIQSEGIWSEQQKLIADDAEDDDYFGYSVSISSDGNTVIIGAYGEDGSGIDTGAAYVFVRSDSTWMQQQKLTGDIQNNSQFGWSVSISGDGNTIIIGAYLEVGAGIDRGATYIFTRSEEVWTEEQKLVASDIEDGDQFGWAVSISGDGNTAIVCAYLEDGTGIDRGAAYIFTRSGEVWTENQKIIASNAHDNDWFGWAVSMSFDGNVTVITARRQHYGTETKESGTTTVASKTSPTIWTQQQKVNSTSVANSSFGSSTAVTQNGNIAVVAAPDPTPTERGSIYIFTRSGEGWIEKQRISADDIEAGDQFGCSVSVSANGDVIVIGAYGTDGEGTDRGSAYVFIRNGTEWLQQSKLVASDASDDDYFGTSVSIASDGNSLVIGAPGKNGEGTDRGAVYIFTQSEGIWSEQQKLIADDAENGDQFGSYVSMSADGNMVFVGASYEDGSGVDRGAVYVFTQSEGIWSS